MKAGSWYSTGAQHRASIIRRPVRMVSAAGGSAKPPPKVSHPSALQLRLQPHGELLESVCRCVIHVPVDCMGVDL